ncbi:MAG: hypothetical protein JKY60_17530 [Kordiimonadaceae bacterium]|nr:hypothetical protein [Kordiimonadaceae bacterium]
MPEWLVGEPDIYSETDVRYLRQKTSVTSPILGPKWEPTLVNIGPAGEIRSTIYDTPILSLYSVQSAFELKPDMVENVCIQSARADFGGLEKWTALISLNNKSAMSEAYEKLISQSGGTGRPLALTRFNPSFGDDVMTLRHVETVLPDPSKNVAAFTVYFGSNDMYALSNILIILEPTHIIKPCTNSDKVDMKIFNRWHDRWNGGLGSGLTLPSGHIDRGHW